MMAGHIVHLELHTPDLTQASEYYSELLRWRPEPVVTTAGSYLALGVAGDVGGGIVECPTPRPLWLPYVAVDCVDHATARAAELGARVLVEPREGPAGWRSVVASEAGGEIAFWRQKELPHPRPQSHWARNLPDGGAPWA